MENFQFLLDSKNLSEYEKARYKKLLDEDMSARTLTGGLERLSKLLEKHYGKKVILLIDEYDVPLAKAHANNYYDKMVSLICVPCSARHSRQTTALNLPC